MSRKSNNHESSNYEKRRAVALRYRQDEDNAPAVAASGEARIADKIIEIAREHGVPVHQNREVAEALMDLKLGEEIPVELYEAVAAILAFVFQADINQEKGDK